MTLNGEPGPTLASMASHPLSVKTTPFQPQPSSLFSSETFQAALKHMVRVLLCATGRTSVVIFYCVTMINAGLWENTEAGICVLWNCTYHSAHNTP